MEFVQVYAFGNYVYAHIRMGMLQEEGINCHLKDEFTLTIDPLLSPMLGGIKLMVESSQVQRAIELLKETE
jgi:hypothetical protein